MDIAKIDLKKDMPLLYNLFGLASSCIFHCENKKDNGKTLSFLHMKKPFFPCHPFTCRYVFFHGATLHHVGFLVLSSSREGSTFSMEPRGSMLAVS